MKGKHSAPLAALVFGIKRVHPGCPDLETVPGPCPETGSHVWVLSHGVLWARCVSAEGVLEGWPWLISPAHAQPHPRHRLPLL